MVLANSYSSLLIPLLTAVLLSSSLSPQKIFASPQFSRQEVLDPANDWFDMGRRVPSSSERLTFNSTDIRAVDFFSDGKYLNATLWINAPFHQRPLSQFGRVSYGMYIDADFNNKTGIDGIDYRVEVMYENGTWTRIFEEWSTFGSSRVIREDLNYTGFAEDGKNFVVLHCDLDAIGSPNIYRVVFFAENKNSLSNWNTDYTNWILVPPPEFVVSTTPATLNAYQGDDVNLEIEVKSTTGTEPQVYLSSLPSTVVQDVEFTQNPFEIPSYGMATSNVHIVVAQEAKPGPHTLIMAANATFPSSQGTAYALGGKSQTTGNSKNQYLPDGLGNENAVRFLSFVITVSQSPGILDQIRGFWDQWGNLLSFLLGSSVFAVLKEKFWKIIKAKISSLRTRKK